MDILLQQPQDWKNVHETIVYYSILHSFSCQINKISDFYAKISYISHDEFIYLKKNNPKLKDKLATKLYREEGIGSL